MLHLKKAPTLRDIQVYVRQLEKERGFSRETVLQKCILLGEEVGELFRAIRKSEKLRISKKSNIAAVDEELADILIYIAVIANRYSIDLEQAFRSKERRNKKRTWQYS